MRKIIILIFICFKCFTLASQNFVDPNTASGTKPANNNIGTGWVLNFSDEFNGDAVNTNKWNIDDSPKSRNPRPEIGINSWFWRPANVEVKNGNLVLKVSKHSATTMHCGSVNSREKYMTKYGYYEARIQVADVTKGTHTAFWLQGPNMGTVDGTGNDGAEIDIFESAWTGDYTKSVIHIDGYGDDHKASTKQYTTPGIHSGYHTFGMHWTKDFIKIYYDGVLKVTYSDTKFIPWVEEYLWLSDGASFGLGDEKDTNMFFVDRPLGFLTEAYVDWIRVWKQDENEPQPINNLIVNGTFDDSGSGWTGNNSDIVYETNTETGINGRTCRLPSIASARNIRQTIGVKPGSTYQFSFKGRVQNVVGASGTQVNNHSTLGIATLKGEIVGAEENVLLSLSSQESSTQELSGDFLVPINITTVTVKLSKDWNVAYLDDVQVIEKINLSTKNNSEKGIIKAYVSHNRIQIDSSIIMKSISLFDITGSVIAHSKPMQSSTTFNLLPSGIYIIEAMLDSGMTSKTKILM